MAKERNPNRDKAFVLYKEHHGNITIIKIAEMLSEKERNVRFWKSEDKWDENYNPKGGAPKGNQNAVGNNGGASERNQNARKEGWYSKYYPTESRNLIKEVEEAGGSTLEILWAQIITQWEWEFQFAWDRQATFLNSQSRAMAQLTSMIKRYEEMLVTNRDLITEEQRLRVQKLKTELKNPELKHRIKHDNEKLKLEKEKFKHQKAMNKEKMW
ncbi:MAG: phage-related terminase-like protein small subunit [Clostridia bacterium]|nr:phage-related terminase-like protein small subunit [Clostridia bacterium]